MVPPADHGGDGGGIWDRHGLLRHAVGPRESLVRSVPERHAERVVGIPGLVPHVSAHRKPWEKELCIGVVVVERDMQRELRGGEVEGDADGDGAGVVF